MAEESEVSAESILVIPDTLHDRYATFGFIPWWDQSKVREATVLVAGAGALGNEVIKNLALLGVGHLLIVDMDRVEMANLSRSVLFRAKDEGQPKAIVAARAARELNPDVRTRAIHGTLARTLGLGVFRRVSAVLGCLDNREARLFINRACWKVGRPWVDGAIGDFLGEARVFWPGKGACYECTLTKNDYRVMNLRYSCSALARALIFEGKIATTPAIASIVAGVQTQEAMKLIHSRDVRPGMAFVYNGMAFDGYTTQLKYRDDCLSHESYHPIRECPTFKAETLTIKQMLEFVQDLLGADAVLELGFDLLVDLECSQGHEPEQVLRPVAEVNESRLICPHCGEQRWPRITHQINGTESFLNRTLAEIGIPPLDILVGRNDSQVSYFELTGDTDSVLFNG
jgi:molybdopterin/thiamine biosynthesis adenylyltransferase